VADHQAVHPLAVGHVPVVLALNLDVQNTSVNQRRNQIRVPLLHVLKFLGPDFHDRDPAGKAIQQSGTIALKEILQHPVKFGDFHD
jgi:hypothetical protein